jgi:hypothetical protein
MILTTPLTTERAALAYIQSIRIVRPIIRPSNPQ